MSRSSVLVTFTVVASAAAARHGDQCQQAQAVADRIGLATQ